MAQPATLIPTVPSWVHSRDFHEPLLNELRRSRHGIRVDLDSGKQVCVSPLVNFRGRATQLNLRTAFHQVSDELFVGIAGRHVSFGIVRAVVQCHVARIRVKDRNNLGLGVPVGDVVLDELKVENGGWQIPFERQGTDTERHLHFCQRHRNVDVKRFF
jgi:hypothetical protein